VLTLLAFGYRNCGKQVSGHMLVNDLMSLLVMHFYTCCATDGDCIPSIFAFGRLQSSLPKALESLF
jgi:hypothetical protein